MRGPRESDNPSASSPWCAGCALTRMETGDCRGDPQVARSMAEDQVQPSGQQQLAPTSIAPQAVSASSKLAGEPEDLARPLKSVISSRAAVCFNSLFIIFQSLSPDSRFSGVSPSPNVPKDLER